MAAPEAAKVSATAPATVARRLRPSLPKGAYIVVSQREVMPRVWSWLSLRITRGRRWSARGSGRTAASASASRRTSGGGRPRKHRLVRRSLARPGGTGASFAFLCLVLDTRQRGGEESIGGQGCENLGGYRGKPFRQGNRPARRLAAGTRERGHAKAATRNRVAAE